MLKFYVPAFGKTATIWGTECGVESTIHFLTRGPFPPGWVIADYMFYAVPMRTF